jgi:hypothetical protein
MAKFCNSILKVMTAHADECNATFSTDALKELLEAECEYKFTPGKVSYERGTWNVRRCFDEAMAKLVEETHISALRAGNLQYSTLVAGNYRIFEATMEKVKRGLKVNKEGVFPSDESDSDGSDMSDESE